MSTPEGAVNREVVEENSRVACWADSERETSLPGIYEQIRDLGLLAVTKEDKLTVETNNTFIQTMAQLEGALSRSDVAGAGIHTIGIDSVMKGKDGGVKGAMVSVTARIPKNNEVLSVPPQKVELLFESESKLFEIVDYQGKQHIRVIKDENGNISLPSIDKNDVLVRAQEPQKIYTSFGGTNYHEDIYTRHVSTEDNRTRRADKRERLLSLAEVIGQTDDLTLASMAMAQATPEDAREIAEALVKRESRKKAELALPELQMVFAKGKGIEQAEEIRNFAPVKQIIAETSAQFPQDRIVGVVCDQITLGKNKEPLFAEVVGVILEPTNPADTTIPTHRVVRIDPRLARKASVVAGVYQENKEGEQSMIIVGEFRSAVGRLYAKQAPAGSTGDRGTTPLTEVVRQEIQEELGIPYPEQLVRLGSYRTHATTTERTELFAATSIEKVQEGTLGGTDEGEVTHIGIEKFPQQGDFRGEPFDAKTTLLAHVGRLNLAAEMERYRFEEWKKELRNKPERVYGFEKILVNRFSDVLGFDGRIGEFGSMDAWRKRINTIYARILGLPESEIEEIIFNPQKEKWDPVTDAREEAQAIIRCAIMLDILMGEKPSVGSAGEAGIIALLGLLRQRPTFAYIGKIENIEALPKNLRESYLRARELFKIDADYLAQLSGGLYTVLDENETLEDIAGKTLEERRAFLAKLTGEWQKTMLPTPPQIKNQVVISGSSNKSAREAIRGSIDRDVVIRHFANNGWKNGAQFWDTKIEEIDGSQDPINPWNVREWTTDFYRDIEIPLKHESLVNVVHINDATSFGATKDVGLAVFRAAINGTYAVISLPEHKDEKGNIVDDDYSRTRTLILTQFERAVREIPWLSHYVRFVDTADELNATVDAIMEANPPIEMAA